MNPKYKTVYLENTHRIVISFLLWCIQEIISQLKAIMKVAMSEILKEIAKNVLFIKFSVQINAQDAIAPTQITTEILRLKY